MQPRGPQRIVRLRRLRFLSLALLLAACSPQQLRRDEVPERCESPDPAALLRAADASVRLVPWQPRLVYDVDNQNRPVPFRLRALAADALAVLSYPEPERFSGGDDDFARMAQRSFVYDNALAVLWLVQKGDLDRARRVLASLVALQRADGAWGFGFNTGSDDGFYNAAYVRSGAVAWVLYAFARYQKASGDLRFAGTTQAGLAWLLAQRDPQTGLYFAGSGRWRDAGHFEPDWPARFFAMEHQIDAWFALKALGHPASQPLARAMMEHLWLADEERFAQGLTPDGRLDRESALDASGTWAALWLVAQGDLTRARQVLAWVEREHAVVASGWSGLRPYRDGPPETWFVEASIAAPLAHRRMGEPEAGQPVWLRVTQLACAADVPLVAAPDWHTDFPFSPAAAPTLWFLLVGSELVAGGAPWLWAER